MTSDRRGDRRAQTAAFVMKWAAIFVKTLRKHQTLKSPKKKPQIRSGKTASPKKSPQIRRHPGYNFFKRPESLDTHMPRQNTLKTPKKGSNIQLEPRNKRLLPGKPFEPTYTQSNARRQLTLASFIAKHRSDAERLQRYI